MELDAKAVGPPQVDEYLANNFMRANSEQLAPPQVNEYLANNFMRANSKQLAPPQVNEYLANNFMRANSEQLAPPQVVTAPAPATDLPTASRSEEHTSELQSRQYLVC